MFNRGLVEITELDGNIKRNPTLFTNFRFTQLLFQAIGIEFTGTTMNFRTKLAFITISLTPLSYLSFHH